MMEDFKKFRKDLASTVKVFDKKDRPIILAMQIIRDNKYHEAKKSHIEEKGIIDFLADISHKTWMKQRAKFKNEPIESLPSLVSAGDKQRARDAWRALEDNKDTHLTRKQAVNLVAQRSHKMWLDYKEEERKKNNGPIEILDQEPNDHDEERAEDIVAAIEARGIMKFE